MPTIPARRPVTLTRTRNEWLAIAHALSHTAATYSTEHGGVDLEDLAEEIVNQMEADGAL